MGLDAQMSLKRALHDFQGLEFAQTLAVAFTECYLPPEFPSSCS